tara:strand:- start:17 stop:385 length:369 start_codon:yes stop_codon:yes gene_type:complete
MRDLENLLDAWMEMIDALQMPHQKILSTPKRRQSWPGSIEETDECVFITVDLPGFDKKSLKLKVNEDNITIEAEQDDRKHRSKKTLPCPVDSSTAKATYKNGVLDIKVCKAEATKGIEVKVE